MFPALSVSRSREGSLRQLIRISVSRIAKDVYVLCSVQCIRRASGQGRRGEPVLRGMVIEYLVPASDGSEESLLPDLSMHHDFNIPM